MDCTLPSGLGVIIKLDTEI